MQFESYKFDFSQPNDNLEFGYLDLNFNDEGLADWKFPQDLPIAVKERLKAPSAQVEEQLPHDFDLNLSQKKLRKLIRKREISMSKRLLKQMAIEDTYKVQAISDLSGQVDKVAGSSLPE